MRRTLRPLAGLATFVVLSAGCGGTGDSGSSRNTSTANTASPHAKAVRFAECMRANGVSAFPDPDASGELTVDAVANGSSVDTSSAAFEQALSACKDLQPSGFTGRERSSEQQSAALKFAQCIRENGVKDFPDPVKGAPLVDTNRIPSASTTAGMSILNAAMQKCGDFAAAAGATGGQ
jgi:hypothetical protein